MHPTQITGVKGAVAAFSSPALSLWPYKFVTGLLERVLDLGATLYTNTPVESAQASDSSVLLSTSKGAVRASKVVYATNGYVAGLLPQYRRVIVPILGQNSRIVPSQTTLDRMPTLATTYNFHYSAAWADYLNPRPDGAVVHGGGGRSLAQDDRGGQGRNSRFNSVDDSRLLNDRVAEDFRTFDEQHFYGWEDGEARVGSTWTGGESVTLRKGVIFLSFANFCWASDGNYQRWAAPCGKGPGDQQPMDFGWLQRRRHVVDPDHDARHR